jgi:hypothetical protein
MSVVPIAIWARFVSAIGQLNATSAISSRSHSWRFEVDKRLRLISRWVITAGGEVT